MTTRGVARNTRPKKLVNKTALPILREYEVENIDDDVQRNITQLETGVERAEESVSTKLTIISITSQFHHVTA